MGGYLSATSEAAQPSETTTATNEKESFVKIDHKDIDAAFKAFTADEVQRSEEEMKKKNIKVSEFLSSRLGDWKSQPLNIAVTGQSGQGKSSFVNTIRDVSADDETYGAPVGTTQTTFEVCSYRDPHNNNLKYWDLPGVGTREFPKSTYLEQVNFSRYDFFLIMSSTRFTENDIWLASEVRKAGKKFYFIRGKIDQDIQNEQTDHPKTFDEETLLYRIRNSTTYELSVEGFKEPQVFLISNKNKVKWDFPKLCHQLVIDSPSLKREAMIMSLRTLSKEFIDEKIKVLQDRIKWVAALAASGSLIPVPGAGIPVNIAVVIHEYKLYKWHLNLDDETLDGFSVCMSHAKQILLLELRAAPMMSLASTQAMSYFFAECATAVAVEGVTEASKLYTMGLSSLVCSMVSYALTYRRLFHILEDLEKTSRKVYELVLNDL